MTTQIERIAYYSKQLSKVIESHGADSDYTTHAFFTLQAAKMGMEVGEGSEWAQKEQERLHKLTLDRL
ncbi:hypothetical protein LMH73_016925 [Vibrio splendidus]|nr:hypothetical protein [Vibrio splendidus]MCC4881841.1 hypothetical protein [Vibrio splendidus]